MKLVPHWRALWRSASIQLAAIAGMVATAIIASPQLLLSLINFIPEEYRPVAAALAGFAVFILPALARAVQQEKLTEARNAAKPE